MNLTEQLILTFISGGIICVIAQLLIDLTRMTPARILVLYVSLGVLIFAVGLFEPMQEIFGAGVSVPLIGFGANIAKGVREAVDEKGLLGALTGGLTGTAGGIAAATFFAYIFALIFRGHPKK